MLAYKRQKTSHPLSSELLETSIYLIENQMFKKISTSEIYEKFGMQFWTESIISHDGQNLLDDQEIIRESIVLQQKIAIEKIKIGDINMYGLVAINKINEGERLIYASKISNNENDDMYKLELDKRTITSARHHGNMARFMNHAPNQKSLDNLITFNTIDIKTNVATANFSGDIININGQEIPILRANRDINIGEKLYWDYGIEYFSGLEIFINLFDIHGSVIDPKTYSWNNQELQIKFNNITRRAGNLDKILESNSIILINFFKEGPHFQLAIHPDYIREKLNNNNNNILSSSKYVTIEILEPFPQEIKVLTLDKELTTEVLRYFKESFLDTNIKIDCKVDLYKLRNDFKEDVNYPHKYISFINFECDQQLAKTIKTKCDNLKIECIYDNTKIFVSFPHLFLHMPAESISNLIAEFKTYKSPSSPSVNSNNFFKISPINNGNNKNFCVLDNEFSSPETQDSFKHL